jgi:hypothetical protein
MASYTPTVPSVANGIVTPAQKKMTLAANYLDIQNDGWTKQYLPELYAEEVDRYGNRTISGFLAMLSAEMPMQSDQVIWSEQGRLHLAYTGTIVPDTGVIAASSIVNIDSGAAEDHAVRVGATIVGIANNKVFKARVSSIDSLSKNITVVPYTDATVEDIISTGAGTTATAVKFFVYGSDFAKGTSSMGESIEPNFKTFTNKPMILKDHFEVNGSDTAQIGWVEVAGESGQGGYLWYLKAAGDTRSRFNDYLEMSMVEAEKVASSSSLSADLGTEGLFAAIEDRGIVATNVVDDASTALADFDTLLGELDKQGAIEENMLFLDRKANLVFDDMLAGLSAGAYGGTAYGVFENSEDMALNLGFTGFRRGSYDFYKTDWKYLNDSSTRGHIGGLDGVLIPAGTSSVYDQMVGANVRRPFLHVRYRASQTDDRKLKSWVTGSVGAYTTGDDKMEIHFLSERCLVVQAANNFVLLK